MPAPRRPVLGYPSMTAAVVDLRKKGKTTREIGKLIERDDNTVLALESAHRRSDALRQRMPVVAGIRMCRVSDFFSAKHLDKLRPDAEARGYSIDQLIKTMVRTIAEDRLVGAVLDDRRVL